MKKTIISRKMYDMAGERSVTTSSSTRNQELYGSRNREKLTDSSNIQGVTSKFSQVKRTGNISVQASAENLSKQASTGNFSELASDSNFSEFASDSNFSELAISSSLLEPEIGRASNFSEIASASNLTESEKDGSHSTKQFSDRIFESVTEQEWVKKLKNLQIDTPKLKLLKNIDLGNLVRICHQHPEFRSLITSMFKINNFVSSSWNKDEQDVLVSIFKNIEAIISEIVSMKSNPDSYDDIEDKFDRLSRYTSDFIDMLHVHMDTLNADKTQYATFLTTLEGRKSFEARDKEVIQDEPMIPKTYLSTRIDTDYLVKIAHENPELQPSVKCVLGVESAMKYLDYEGQFKVHKVLARVVRLLRKIVEQKSHPIWQKYGYLDDTTESLIERIHESFNEIMSNLSHQCEKLKKKSIPCESCPSIFKMIKNVNVKSQELRLRRSENPHSFLKGVVAVANHGINADYLKNLETLFHHLAAKRGAYRHVKLYRTVVNWFEIALQHEEYKSKSNETKDKLQLMKTHILRRFDEYEEVMEGAREFSERFRRTYFLNPKNLSDEFGLSGQLETLASEVEGYLINLHRLISHFLEDLKRYRTLSVSIRKDRNSFLTKPQTFAFDFPL